MEQDLFTHLPSEIITNIILRLPLRNIAISKCVCKAWLDFLSNDDFVKSHISKSISSPSLAVLTPSNLCKIFDLERWHEYDDPTLITKFDFPRRIPSMHMAGCAEGLLFLYHDNINSVDLYVCNPITREYIELRCPHELYYYRSHYRVQHTYGFGASKVTGQHKVVRIINPRSGYFFVYTLGTGGPWRSVGALSSFDYIHSVQSFGLFVDGNLYWLVDSYSRPMIYCFDLETERCTTFTPPRRRRRAIQLLSLRDCLCFCCESSSQVNTIVIWLMKEHGVEKSWCKDYVIKLNPEFDVVQPIKVFNYGEILMLWDGNRFFCYSIETPTYHKIDTFGAHGNDSLILTPTLLSLKSLGMENVISF